MKKKILLLFIIILMATNHVYGLALEENWIFSTAYIVNQPTSGSGFFVLRPVLAPDAGKVFLITNKHVLRPQERDESKDELGYKIKIFITVEKGKDLASQEIEILLIDTKGEKLWFEHPSKKVDIAGIDVTKYVTLKSKLREGYKITPIFESKFTSEKKIKESLVAVGDKVVLLGYPLNIIEGNSAIPVGRAGIIASPPDKNFKGLPGFLIDCATIRGSSGSPVFLPIRPYTVTRENGKLKINPFEINPPSLIGIVSATIKDWELIIKRTEIFGRQPQTFSVIETANFGIVYNADAIIETINESGIKKYEDSN